MDALCRYLVIALISLPLLVSGQEPRGYRNHNPGNLVVSSIEWQGKVPCTNGEIVHECFKNDYYGLRAMALTLKSYMTKHGLTTVRDIMVRFSEFEGAGPAVARISGFAIDQQLSLRDMYTMVTLMQAIVVQENGYSKYTDADIVGVLYAAYGANHFSGKYGTSRGAQDLGHEAAGQAGTAQHDDAGAGRKDGRAHGDSSKHGQGIHVDAKDNCSCRCVLSDRTAESSRDPVPLPASDSWLDRVGAGVLAVQRWIGTASVARCEGTGDNPNGHAAGVSYCWTLLWW